MRWVDQSRRGIAGRPDAFRLIVMRHTQLPAQREKNKSKLLIKPLPCRGHGKKRVAHSHRGQLFPQLYDVRVRLLKALICDIQRGVWRKKRRRKKKKEKKKKRYIHSTDRIILYACAKWSWWCWVFSTICCELWQALKNVEEMNSALANPASNWAVQLGNKRGKLWGWTHACVILYETLLTNSLRKPQG